MRIENVQLLFIRTLFRTLCGLLLALSATAQIPTDIPTDTLISAQWGLDYTARAPGANVLPVLSDFKLKHEVVVAVIDTGINTRHPDLKEALWRNASEIPGNGKDDDRNGFIDDVHGYNFAGTTVKENADLSDPDGHGTHVAGIIAATHNGQGIAGVNPLAKIMMLKVPSEFDPQNETQFWETIATAIDYAVKNGAEVINISLGTYTPYASLKTAIDRAARKNVLVVAAAGNSGSKKKEYPAAFGLHNIVSVAASNDTRGIRWLQSNFGKNHVDIFAPGENIISTSKNGDYENLSGTSMATPFVSGVASLVISVNGSQKASQLRQRLIDTSRRFETLSGLVSSNGLINAYGAVSGQTSLNLIWDRD